MDDPILSPSGKNAKEKSTTYTPFHIYNQNVSIMKLSAGDKFTNHAANFLADLGTGVACLSETNTNWKHAEAFPRVHDTLK